MKKIPPALFILMLLAFFSCASTPPDVLETQSAPLPEKPATDIWPKMYADETFLADFSSSWSQDEAIGTIKNLQNSFVDHTADLPISQLDVDAYGLRARWSWTENGAFVKSSGFVIPFDQVSSILLEHYPAIEKAYTWGLNIYITGSNPVIIRCSGRDVATRLGKAIITLSKARSAPLNLPDARLGAALSALNPAQAQAAGISQGSGVIVQWIFMESPSEKAGVQPHDIFMHVAGKPISKTEDIFSAISDAVKRGDTVLPISGLRRTYRKSESSYVEEFAAIEFALPVSPSGAAELSSPDKTSLAFSVVPAWQIEKKIASEPETPVAAPEPALSTFFFGYVVPSISGSLAPSIEPWLGPIKLSFGMEMSGSGRSSFLSGIEAELFINFTDSGSMFLFNDMAMIGYSFNLDPLYLNAGMRVGLAILDVSDDLGQSYTALGAVGGPEASVYLKLDPSLFLWARGRYAFSAYMSLDSGAGNPVASGSNRLDLLSLEAGLAFKI